MVLLSLLALAFQGTNPVSGPLPPDLNLEAGAPGYGDPDKALLLREGYACLVSSKYKDPLWSQEHLTADDLLPPQFLRPKSEPFKADPDLSPAFLATKADYTKSGYDKGHMAPSGDFGRHSQMYPNDPRHTQNESYYLSNMVPQNSRLNQVLWNHFETKIKSLVVGYGEVQIITGPIFTHTPLKTIGKGKVAVPDEIFKIVVVTSGPSYGAWYAVEVPNVDPGKQPLSTFLATVGKIEHDTGLDFFTSWPPEDKAKLDAGTLPKMPISATFK